MTKENLNALKILSQELDDPYRQLNVVFSLTSVIPVLTLVYLLGNALLGNAQSLSDAAPAFLFLLVILISGYAVGHRIIRTIVKKTASYAGRAKRSDEIKSLFAMSLAHDLKIPLSVMKANFSNLKTEFLGPTTPQQNEIFDVCQNVVNRMDVILTELMDTYQIEARTAEPKITALNLCELIEDQRRECAALAGAKKILLTLHLSKKPLLIDGDETLISRALNNLFGNAIKYTPVSGRVTIKTQAVSGFARIEFLNTGSPIPEGQLEKIFDKFERLDPSTEGQGLGLAIARDIVELHHGKIWAESEPGKPNRFTVLLALANG